MSLNWINVRNQLVCGKPILVFDSVEREAEVDMVFYAENIDAGRINYLRKNAGGLICYVSGSLFRETLNLPFLQEVLLREKSLKELSSRRPKYGDPPAFNVWVNHVSTHTGINDRDRALTIRSLHEVASLIYKGYLNEARERFSREFYAPGHVPILTSRGLAYRKGHTELVTALALIVGLTPSMVISEMLAEGSSLPYEDAKKFAQRGGFVLIDGVDIVIEAEKRGVLND